MKKLFTFLFLCAYIQGPAQTDPEDSYLLGISPGYHFSRVNFDPSTQGMLSFSTDQLFKPGYHGGVVFIYYPEPKRALRMELNYSRRGWEESSDTTGFYSRELNYLVFPFLSHFDLRGKRLNLFITAGPTVSYLISDREVINPVDEEILQSHYHLDIDNRLEAGLSVGIGLSSDTRIGSFQVECRVYQGLTNMFSETSDFGYSSSQNQVIGIKLAYLYAL